MGRNILNQILSNVQQGTGLTAHCDAMLVFFLFARHRVASHACARSFVSSNLRFSSSQQKIKNRNLQAPVFDLVAGTGLEPATFGL